MDISEKSFGISEYISDHKGFFGIIKQRFSDFQVNEITSSGNIVHLTSEESIPIPENTVPKNNIERPSEITDEDIEILKVISGQKSVKDFQPSVLLVKSDSGESDYKLNNEALKTRELKIKVGEVSKEKRTMMHMYVKAQFPNLNSSTKELGSEKFICITRRDNALKQDKRNIWPKSQTQVNFVLYKENIDTMEAINVLAGKLGLKPGMFCYAGTKDRRAKTSQLVSIYQVAPNNISSAARAINRIRVGNFFYNNKPQKLGQAKGNHFKIVLREVDGDPDVIDEAVSSLKERGFINYFGMQRFSSTCVSTHVIGRAILRGDYGEAVDLILSGRNNDLSDLAEAKKIWEKTRDAKSALKTLRPKACHSIEGKLLMGLAECGSNNFLNALDKIPRNTKLMYIHAYQSYLWNNVVSKRIQKYKLKVLPGDTVRNKKKTGSGQEEEENENEENSSDKVRILTAEEAKTVDIKEVMMPLPGNSTIYPDNEIKEWYMEYLRKDDLTVDAFQNKVKTYSLDGAYRPMIAYPESVETTGCFYVDATQPLIQSDLDALQGIDVEENRLPDGPYQALIIEFSLPSSAYATMALRELLKMETSSKFQSTLNTTCGYVKSDSTTQKRKFEEEAESEKKQKVEDTDAAVRLEGT